MSRIFFLLCFVLKVSLYSEALPNSSVPAVFFSNNSLSSPLDSLIGDIKEFNSILDSEIGSSGLSVNTENAFIISPNLDSFIPQLNSDTTSELSKETEDSSFSEQDQEADAIKELPIVLVIPSYNNADWYTSNLDSALMQSYQNYRIIYINDCSTDETSQVVEEKIKTEGIDYHVLSFSCSDDEDIPSTTKRFTDLINQEKHFFTLINNTKRSGALANLYRAIHSCDNNEIIGILDGDDWLLHEEVLQEINALYLNRNIWLTHGRFLEYPHRGSSWNMFIPEEIVKYNAFRYYRLPSHFRTFYTWLFKRIQLDDLLYKGNFYPMTGDMAMMFPMIEMAAERHAFVNEINYVYNMANELNDNKQNAILQRELDAHIRSLPFYHRIENESLTLPGALKTD